MHSAARLDCLHAHLPCTQHHRLMLLLNLQSSVSSGHVMVHHLVLPTLVFLVLLVIGGQWLDSSADHEALQQMFIDVQARMAAKMSELE